MSKSLVGTQRSGRRLINSKTGCLRCRYRKKKCDEAHPVCVACSRNKFSCIWPDKPSRDRHLLPTKKRFTELSMLLHLHAKQRAGKISDLQTALPDLLSKLASSEQEAFNKDEREDQLLLQLTKLCAKLDGNIDSRQFRQEGYVLAVTLETVWLRDDLMAFAALIFSIRRDTLKCRAHQYYSKAVQQIDRQLSDDELHQESNSLLVACFLLASMDVLMIVEANQSKTSDGKVTHFETVDRLLSRTDDFATTCNNTKPAQSFRRTAHESFLSALAVMSFFDSHTDLYPSLNIQIENSFYCDEESLGQDSMLRVHYSIHADLIQLLRLTRRRQPVDAASAAAVLQIRDDIQRTLNHARSRLLQPKSLTMPDAIRGYWSDTVLASICLLVLYSKIDDRTLCAKDVALRPLMQEALSLLERYRLLSAWNGELCWILVILFCCAHTISEADRLANVTERLKYGLGSVGLTKLQKVLDNIVDIRRHQVGNPQTRASNLTQSTTASSADLEDTLDLLLCLDGLF